MPLFGGSKKKKVPNSRKKKGGLAKGDSNVTDSGDEIDIVDDISDEIVDDVVDDKPSEQPVISETETKKETPKFGLFGKNKSKANASDANTSTPSVVPEKPQEVDTANDKPTESQIATKKEKKKFGLFGKSESKTEATETSTPSDPKTAKPTGSNDTTKTKKKKAAPAKIGKLSANKINALVIPGMGKPKGTSTSKTISGKPPPKIDIYGVTEQTRESQGHAQMSEKAKEIRVGPKDMNHTKEDWKLLYELAVQYDSYKAQEADAMKKSSKTKKSPAKQQQAPPPEPVSGDTKAIKNSLNGLFGGGTMAGGMNYTANGSFLNNKYFDQYLKEHSSGVALEFSSETSLYKRFNRKDQEQRTISEKFVTALLKHPKAKKITQLNMSSAILPDSFMVALCDQCLSGNGLPLLQIMNLESNDLGRESIEALSKCIASPKAWRRLQILKLENQKREVSAGAEEVLGEAIVQSSSLVAVGLRIKGGIAKQQIDNTTQANLDKLRVARRQHASKKGTLKARKRNEMEALFDTIAANKDKSIKEVDLTENLRFLGLNATERTKTGAAFATNKTVTTITMTKLKLDDDFAEALGKALVKNTTLVTVVLDSNSFSARGIKALLTGLGQNKSVTNFQFRHQSKTLASSDEEGLPELLKNNTTLINLGTDVRNPLIKSQLDRKTNGNRELQRKQRVAQKK